MAITFGGLATGLDTATIVESLMAVEKLPLERLEVDKTWQTNRLNALKEFDAKLNSFLGNVKSLTDRDQYFTKKVSTNSDDYFTASVTNDAIAGTNYSVEVKSLAQVQKSFSNTVDGAGNDIGFSSKEESILGTGDVTITVNGTDHTITLTDDNNSLTGFMEAINKADIGVSAAILNDGTDNPYRLTLTGSSVENTFSVNTSDLAGGTKAFHNFEVSVAAKKAHVVIDGIDIYSNSNTVKDGIPGVSLNLLKATADEFTKVAISEDSGAVEKNIQSFISGYNAVVSFVSGQSTLGDTKAGILSGDSGLNSIKRHLQDMLTSLNSSSGNLKTLSQLGLETQNNGTLTLNSETLSDAKDADFDSLVNLLAGEDGEENGIAHKFETYLEGLTHSSTGMFAGRSKAINTNIDNMETRITQMEERLVKREETIRAQFNSMELLVSTMNSQSAFLTQQLSYISNLSGNK